MKNKVIDFKKEEPCLILNFLNKSDARPLAFEMLQCQYEHTNLFRTKCG